MYNLLIYLSGTAVVSNACFYFEDSRLFFPRPLAFSTDTNKRVLSSCRPAVCCSSANESFWCCASAVCLFVLECCENVEINDGRRIICGSLRNQGRMVANWELSIVYPQSVSRSVCGGDGRPSFAKRKCDYLALKWRQSEAPIIQSRRCWLWGDGGGRGGRQNCSSKETLLEWKGIVARSEKFLQHCCSS